VGATVQVSQILDSSGADLSAKRLRSDIRGVSFKAALFTIDSTPRSWPDHVLLGEWDLPALLELPYSQF
jgi:hypothetical protein